MDALDFTFEPAPRRRARTAITRELNRRDRTRVYDAWDGAHACQPAVPLFPGSSHGRRARPAIRRTLQMLDAPASLWEDPPDTELGTGDSADGRALLHRLTAWNRWHYPTTRGRAPGRRGSLTPSLRIR